MSTLVKTLKAARAAQDPARLSEAVPYAHWLGLSAVLDGGELRGVLRYAPDLIGNATLPALHGGTIGALLESTAIFELLFRTDILDDVHVPKTITLTVDYLRPARPVDVWARAIVTRQGRRVANVRIEAWQEDPARPVATAHGLFLLQGAIEPA